MEPIPIILYQVSPSHALECSLFQARHTNPDSPIILIGDRANNKFPFVTFVDVEEFSELRRRLRSIYVHKSVNSFEFELSCIERWVIMSELLIKRRFLRCFHMDSDVLIYTNLTEELERYSTIDMSTNTYSTLINNAQTLHDFSSFIFAYFGDLSEGSFINLDSKKYEDRSVSFNICDMSLLERFVEISTYRFANLVSVSDGLFDHNINSPDGFEPDQAGRKSVFWSDYVPYGRRDNNNVRFSSLHFQGPAKPFIFDYYSMKRTVVESASEAHEREYHSKVHVSVVLLEHDRELARQTLNDLRTQTIPLDSIEIVLITLDENLDTSAFKDLSGEFAALKVIFLENFNSQTLSRAIVENAQYELIVFFSRKVKISEHSLSAHLDAWSEDSVSIRIGRIEAAPPESRTALSKIIETLPMPREYSFLKNGIIHPFNCFHLSNTSFSKTSLHDLPVSNEPKNSPVSFIELEWGYLLWIKGYRVRGMSASPCIEKDALNYAELIEREKWFAIGLSLFIKRYPETRTHHFGWSDITRRSFALKIQELQSNYAISDMRSVVEALQCHSAQVKINDADFSTIQYMLLVALNLKRCEILEERFESPL